jgi:hypothetical protein
MNQPTKGYVEVGDDGLDVIVNHPDLQPDDKGVGHIVFSPDEARHFARLLLNRAYQLDAGSLEEALVAEARRPVGITEMIEDGIGDLIPKLADALDRHLAPIPMVLHCPSCGNQHIDAPEPENGWTNPPHRSHKCSSCGDIWRPADVPTTGVLNVNTRGSVDTWPPRGEADDFTPSSRLDCGHRRTLFLQGAFGSNGPESVSVCRDCGQFKIFADRKGVHFSINFSLWGCDALIAASQTWRTALKGETAEQLSTRVWKPLDFAGLRLYHVVLRFETKVGDQRARGNKHFTVAATAPRRAAAIIEQMCKSSYEDHPNIAYWSVDGYPLEVLQPLEWTENGISILNIDWLRRVEQLETAIKKVVTQNGDDICWMDVYKDLGSLVGIEFNPEMLPRDEMLSNCAKFVDSLLTGTEYKLTVEYPAEINCVCGESFTIEEPCKAGEHLHCPHCGSYYDTSLQFHISKRQSSVLAIHKDEWEELKPCGGNDA